MVVEREVTCIKRRYIYFDPHERVAALGGEYLGWPWEMSDFLVLYNINHGIERYVVRENNHVYSVVVGLHNGAEYLKSEGDGYSPHRLLALRDCPPHD